MSNSSTLVQVYTIHIQPNLGIYGTGVSTFCITGFSRYSILFLNTTKVSTFAGSWVFLFLNSPLNCFLSTSRYAVASATDVSIFNVSSSGITSTILSTGSSIYTVSFTLTTLSLYSTLCIVCVGT